jgi:hypothetical protein
MPVGYWIFPSFWPTGLICTGHRLAPRRVLKFYKDLIRDAERIYAAWLEKKTKGKEQ